MIINTFQSSNINYTICIDVKIKDIIYVQRIRSIAIGTATCTTEEKVIEGSLDA